MTQSTATGPDAPTTDMQRAMGRIVTDGQRGGQVREVGDVAGRRGAALGAEAGHGELAHPIGLSHEPGELAGGARQHRGRSVGAARERLGAHADRALVHRTPGFADRLPARGALEQLHAETNLPNRDHLLEVAHSALGKPGDGWKLAIGDMFGNTYQKPAKGQAQIEAEASNSNKMIPYGNGNFSGANPTVNSNVTIQKPMQMPPQKPLKPANSPQPQ